MAKPSVSVTWGTGSAVIVEPSSGEKAAGMDVGNKFPAQWFNFLFNGIWQWIVWLAAFESTVHAWSAEQDFNGASGNGQVVIGPGTWLGNGSLEANGFGGTAAVFAQAGGTSGAFAIRSFGANVAGNFGTNGNIGTGGTGHILGGIGSAGIGGAATAINGIGGPGGDFIGGAGATTGTGTGGAGHVATGGAIDGTTNTTGAAGPGAVSTGGAVTSDANGRVGGDGHQSTGGQGQGGYGPAYHAIHGGVQVDDGASSFGGAVAVVGPLNALAAASVFGLLSAVGGIALEGVTTVTGFATHFVSGTPTMACWKDPLGYVGFQGILQFVTGVTVGGVTSVLSTPLNSRFWPIKNVSLVCGFDPAGLPAQLNIFTDGTMSITLPTGFAIGGTFNLAVDAIRYRTT